MKSLLLATDLVESKGGIAAVNLAIVHRLRKQSPVRGDLRIVSLHDQAVPAALADLEVSFCRGNQFRFACLAVWYSLQARLIIAGHVRLALPLLLVPGICRRLVIFGHGSEVTHRLRDSSRRVLERAALVLANSARTANRIRLAAPGCDPVACPLGLAVRPPAADVQDTAMTLESVDGKPLRVGRQMLLLVGRMDPDEQRKGHRELLAAAARLRSAFPALQIVFAGPGEDQQTLRKLASKLGIASSVAVFGPVERTMLDALYARCFAFVMPSQQEGFGLVYLEAMSFGKPCIGCFDDGAEEVIKHEVTGLLIRDQKDERELANAIAQLLDDPGRADAMGQAGYARLLDQFTPEAFDARLAAALARFR